MKFKIIALYNIVTCFYTYYNTYIILYMVVKIFRHETHKNLLKPTNSIQTFVVKKKNNIKQTIVRHVSVQVLLFSIVRDVTRAY